MPGPLKTFLIAAFTAGLAFHATSQGMVSVKASNDMTYFTDRYFSNGIELGVYGHFAARLPFGRLLIPDAGNDRVFYSFTLTHNMYTPSDTYTPEIDPDDHPYAAYLLLGVRKESFNPIQKVLVDSRLEIGWIGPLAGGEVFQNSMHAVISIAEHVEGWHNQVGNDLCLQYSAGMEKGLVSLSWLEVNGYLKGRLGSPHSDARTGMLLRLGRFDPYFNHPGPGGRRIFQLWGFCSGDANLVCYDATLQGGLNNRNNPHTLSSIKPLYWHLAFGGALIYKKIKLELGQEVVSPQFLAMGWHRWAYVAVMMGL